MNTGALDGIRIIDLTTVLMGPLATRMLGDHGADVIRVESPSGDSTRNGLPARNPGMSGFSLNLQRNKRSLSIDLKSADGHEVMIKLISSADVLVTNMRSQALERLGLDEKEITKKFPELIYCRANGFGSSGPYRDKAAYDDAIQAASGLSGLIGSAQGKPGYVPAVIADKVTGLHIVQAVMAALLFKARTGKGQHIEVPMFETMVTFNLVEHLRGPVFEPSEGPFGYERLLSKSRNPVETSDGFMCILPYTDQNYRDFFTYIDSPDLAEDQRFRDHNSRIEHTDELYQLIADAAAEYTTQEWLDFCDERSIPAAAVLDLKNVHLDPHLSEVNLMNIVEHPSEGRYKYVRDPVEYSKSPTQLRFHAPRLGEHTKELLAQLGYEKEHIEELITNGAVVSE